jgi:hypothetical protein
MIASQINVIEAKSVTNLGNFLQQNPIYCQRPQILFAVIAVCKALW